MKKNNVDWDMWTKPDGHKSIDAMVKNITGVLIGMIAGAVAYLIFVN